MVKISWLYPWPNQTWGSIHKISYVYTYTLNLLQTYAYVYCTIHKNCHKIKTLSYVCYSRVLSYRQCSCRHCREMRSRCIFAHLHSQNHLAHLSTDIYNEVTSFLSIPLFYCMYVYNYRHKKNPNVPDIKNIFSLEDNSLFYNSVIIFPGMILL